MFVFLCVCCFLCFLYCVFVVCVFAVCAFVVSCVCCVFVALCWSEECVDPEEMKGYEWILPETTANFEQLPVQYRGVCGYTLVEKNGLLLPGSW